MGIESIVNAVFDKFIIKYLFAYLLNYYEYGFVVNVQFVN